MNDRQGIPATVASSPDSKAALSASERRALRIDGIIYYAGSLASGLVAILLVPVMLRTLGVDAYGLWIAALAFGTVVVALDVGLGSAVAWVVAGGTDRLSGSDAARFVRSAGSLYLWIGAADALLVALVGPIVVGWGFTGSTLDVAVVVTCCGVAAAADQVIAFSSAVLGGQRRYATLSRILLVTGLSRSLGTLIVIWSGGGLRGVALTYAAISALNAWDAAGTLKRSGDHYRVRIGAVDWSAIRPYLGFGFKSFVVGAIVTMTWHMAPMLIGMLRGTAEIPLFYAAQKFPLAIVALSSRFSIVFFSAASRDAVEHGAARVGDLVVAGTRSTLSLVLPYCLILSVVAPELLQAWLGPVSKETVLVMRLTSAAVLADALGATALQVLWGQGALTALLPTVSAMGVATAGLTVMLVPRFGTAAAAASLVVSVGGAAIALLAATARRSGDRLVSILARALTGLVGPAFLAGATAWLTLRALPPTGWSGVALAASLGGIVYLLAYYIFGVPDEERAMLSELLPSSRGVVERLRQRARGWTTLRSAWYLAHHIALLQRDHPGERPSAYSRTYEHIDPWGYETEWGAAHLRVTAEVLDAAGNGARFGSALEIGCGEGFVTELLAPRCDSVLATDIIPHALERAAQRLPTSPHVRFASFDLLRDPGSSRYDLIVLMGVLECLSRRHEFRAARRRILHLLAPGGYLLVTTARQHPVVEGARWARWLIRGAESIHAFLMASGRLTLCRSVSTPTHLFSLYRHSSPS